MSTVSANQIAKIWKEELETVSKKIIMASVTGTRLVTELVQAEIEVPTAVMDALRNACKRAEIEEGMIKEMVGGMASAGFSKALEDKLGVTKDKPQTPSAPAQNNQNADQLLGQINTGGFDLSGLSDKMNQIQKVVTQLGGMTEIFKNAEPSKTNVDTEDTPNCVKSNIPTG